MSGFVFNNLNQKIGLSLMDWKPAQIPSLEIIEGKYCRLERLNPKVHGHDLFEANILDKEGKNWTYLFYGPFDDYQKYLNWLEEVAAKPDPYFYSIIDTKTKKAAGLASLMRIDPAIGSIEVGHLNFSPLLQKKIAATEAMYLLMKYSFELGYRRYEWKCDHLNQPSREAALRLGFKYEGTFRQATIYKGRSRDTDWFSIIDSEWPKLQLAFESWLSKDNFTQDQKQKRSLRELTKI